ncbi:MAG: hypothetical protein AAB436_00355 [Patescibacteria group bacterium]
MPSQLTVPSCLEQIRTFAAQSDDSNFDLFGGIAPVNSLSIVPRDEKAKRLGARINQLPGANSSILGMTLALVDIPPTQEAAGDGLGLFLINFYDAVEDDGSSGHYAISVGLNHGHQRYDTGIIGGNRVNFLDTNLATLDLNLNLLEQVMDVAERHATAPALPAPKPE